MRIGIMGGTLDPVHNGHLAIAEAVRERCGLDEILLLPAGDPPHKRREVDRFDRLCMAQLAAEDCPGVVASDEEVRREGTTYTVDTLHALHQRRPDVEWVYVVGADTVRVMDQWRSFGEVARLCAFAAVGRPGEDGLAEEVRRLEVEFGARIQTMDFDGPDISSSEIRRRVARGESIDGLTPKKVADYIRQKGLYLCALTWSEMEKRLSGRLKPSRFIHTLGVAATAERLAPRYGVDPQRARLAGMLHDCAKSMPADEMRALVRENVPDADEAELAMEPVLHAPAGMVVARDEFGVQDPDVLSAIRNHTLGRRGMSPLETLIFVSDFIEPNRAPFEGLEEARTLAETDLRAAARRCAELSNDFVLRRGGQVHPRTAEMLKYWEEKE